MRGQKINKKKKKKEQKLKLKVANGKVSVIKFLTGYDS